MHLTLHLTEKCNMGCAYCFAGEKVGPTMEAQTYRKAFQIALAQTDLRGEKHVAVTFFGGEPLLCKDSIYEIVNEYGSHPRVQSGELTLGYSITTNGTLLDEEFIRFAQKHFMFITLSIDGIEAAHNADRVMAGGRTGTFNRVKQALDLVAARTPSFATYSVITPKNVAYLPESVDFLYKSGSRVMVLAADFQGAWTWESFKALEKSYKKVADWYVDMTLKGRHFYLAPFDEKMKLHTQGPSCKDECSIGKSSISVDPNGRLYPCQGFVNQPVDLPIGDVHNGVNLAERNRIYALSQAEKFPCNTCAIRERCRHKCSCLSFSTTGRIDGVSPFVCAHEKMLLPIADSIGERLYKKRNPLFINKHYNRAYDMMRVIEEIIHDKADDDLLARASAVKA